MTSLQTPYSHFPIHCLPTPHRPARVNDGQHPNKAIEDHHLSITVPFMRRPLSSSSPINKRPLLSVPVGGTVVHDFDLRIDYTSSHCPTVRLRQCNNSIFQPLLRRKRSDPFQINAWRRELAKYSSLRRICESERTPAVATRSSSPSSLSTPRSILSYILILSGRVPLVVAVKGIYIIDS